MSELSNINGNSSHIDSVCNTTTNNNKLKLINYKLKKIRMQNSNTLFIGRKVKLFAQSSLLKIYYPPVIVKFCE